MPVQGHRFDSTAREANKKGHGFSENVEDFRHGGSRISFSLKHWVGDIGFGYDLEGNDDRYVGAAMRYVCAAAGTNHWSEVHKRYVRVITSAPVSSKNTPVKIVAIGHLLQDRWVHWNSFKCGQLADLNCYPA